MQPDARSTASANSDDTRPLVNRRRKATDRDRLRAAMHYPPRISRRAGMLAVLVGAWAIVAFAQIRVEPALLTFKKALAEQQQAALAVPFTGVSTADGRVDGLFPIRATGVSTEPLRAAADAFLATLTPAQIIRTVFADRRLGVAPLVERRQRHLRSPGRQPPRDDRRAATRRHGPGPRVAEREGADAGRKHHEDGPDAARDQWRRRLATMSGSTSSP